jgi:hypothetical protein
MYACVDKIIQGIADIQIQLYKAKHDDTLCLCKKHLLDLFGKRLQHLIMLTASTKYLNQNWHIEFDNLITKLKSEIEQDIVRHDVVSPIIEDMYVSIIKAILNRYPILTNKLLEIKDYESFIRILNSRVKKVYNVIYTLFKLTYPICTDFNPSGCSNVCINTCINKGLFEHTTMIIPTSIMDEFSKFEMEIYDLVINIAKSYIEFSNLHVLVCGPLTDSVKRYLTERGFKESQIKVSSNCPISLDNLKFKRGALCYV